MGRPLFHIGELSRRTATSRDLLRAWERRYGLLRPRRSPGGFRLYGGDDVSRVRLMQHYLRQNLPAAQAAELVREAGTTGRHDHPGIPPGDARKGIAMLAVGLERFDELPAGQVLDRLLEVFTPGAVLTDVVLPYLRGLGDRWACGETTVAQEHFASRYLEGRLLAMLRGPARGPKAVLACPPAEQHTLGLLAMGIALRDRGWQLTYLGADTPPGAAAFAAARTSALVVVLAAVEPGPFAAAETELRRLAAEHVVALGGAGAGVEIAAATGARALPADPLAAARALDAAVAHT